MTYPESCAATHSRRSGLSKNEIIAPQVEETADGSRTLYLPDLDEHYHSVYGARTESMHVFVRNGLLKYCEEERKRQITILEVGFGTGLNALLTILAQPLDCKICYHTYEIHPLEQELVGQLFEKNLPQDEWKLMQKLHRATWNKEYEVTDQFRIYKHDEDILQADLPLSDVLYMDAFAPDKAPLLWSETQLQRLANATTNNGRLSTYCAKGGVRRRLEGVGFRVERTPGPPGGKREILTCKKRPTT